MASIESNSDHGFWQNHIAQWQSSGLSQADYCRQQTLRAHQFSYWKCKFSEGSKPVAPGPKTGFTRVQVAAHVATPTSPGLSLHFQDGTQVTGITQDNLALIKPLLEVLR